ARAARAAPTRRATATGRGTSTSQVTSMGRVTSEAGAPAWLALRSAALPLPPARQWAPPSFASSEARDLGSVSPLGSSPRSLVAPRLSSRHGCRFRWGQIAALEPFERWFEMEHERTLPVTDDPRECRTTRSSRFRQTTPLLLEAETRAPPTAPSRGCHFLARLP